MIVTPPPSCGSTAKALEVLSPPALMIERRRDGGEGDAAAERQARAAPAPGGRGLRTWPTGTNRVDKRRSPRLQGGVVGKKG